MEHHEPCAPIELVQSKYCTITKCEACSSYHLHIGPVSIRLREEVFYDVCQTLVNVYMKRDERPRHKHQKAHRH